MKTQLFFMRLSWLGVKFLYYILPYLNLILRILLYAAASVVVFVILVLVL